MAGASKGKGIKGGKDAVELVGSCGVYLWTVRKASTWEEVGIDLNIYATYPIISRSTVKCLSMSSCESDLCRQLSAVDHAENICSHPKSVGHVEISKSAGVIILGDDLGKALPRSAL